MKTLHIVPHTHWDREWYFTSQESQVLLYQHMKELLGFMEEHPDYPYYVLDGQTVLLEDYLEACPEDQQRIEKLAKEGRLILGPWYTQTDEMIVGAESIARNLYYGWLDCRRVSGEAGDGRFTEAQKGAWGRETSSALRMNVGYLPDSFGQCAQMPMLLQQAEIPYSVFWRGTSSRHGLGSEFRWESEDGSRVLVQQLPLCYALGRFLESDDRLKKRMDMTMKALEKYASEGVTDFVLPNGFDQMPVQKDLTEIMEHLREWYPDWNFVQDSYENVCALQAERKNLPTWRGEFLDGSHARVHRSIYSTRMDLKVKNTKLEQYITHIAEPLGAMAWKLGFDYPRGLYEKMWKELLKNHAHDSMGCCCSDQVHANIDARYEDVRQRAEMLAKYAMRSIADHQTRVDLPVSGENPERILLFNTLPVERIETVIGQVVTRHDAFLLRDVKGAVVDYQILAEEPVDASVVFRELRRRDTEGNDWPFIRYTIAVKRELPAFGYETLYLDFEGSSTRTETNAVRPGMEEIVERNRKGDMVFTENAVPADRPIEDDFYRVSVRLNGRFDVYDKRTGRLYPELGQWQDDGDEGDEYDYSPPKGDVLLSEVQVRSIEAKQGALVSELNCVLTMPVYRNLEARCRKGVQERDCADRDEESRNGQQEDMISLELTCRVTLQNDGLIRFHVEADNQADDHRLRLLFPTGITSEYSHASQAFGEICRPVEDERMAVWEEEKWDERPDSIYPMLDYVYLQDEEHGVGLLTNGGREYEIVGENRDTIAFTVFRSVGICGADELVRRPGRLSGIALPTPAAQVHKRISQDFAIAMFAPGSCAQASQEYQWPTVLYHHGERQEFSLGKREVETPARIGLLTVEGDAMVSTVKKAETEDGLVVRLYNPLEQEVACSFGVSGQGGSWKVQRVNLLERSENDTEENRKKAVETTEETSAEKIAEARLRYRLKKNQVDGYLVTD